MTAPARRPWWRKKRWAAAGLLWLVVAYPLSVGPAGYARGREWLPQRVYVAVYAPLRAVIRPFDAPGRWLGRYYVRCLEAGIRDAASD